MFVLLSGFLPSSTGSKRSVSGRGIRGGSDGCVFATPIPSSILVISPITVVIGKNNYLRVLKLIRARARKGLSLPIAGLGKAAEIFGGSPTSGVEPAVPGSVPKRDPPGVTMPGKRNSVSMLSEISEKVCKRSLLITSVRLFLGWAKRFRSRTRFRSTCFLGASL